MGSNGEYNVMDDQETRFGLKKYLIINSYNCSLETLPLRFLSMICT